MFRCRSRRRTNGIGAELCQYSRSASDRPTRSHGPRHVLSRLGPSDFARADYRLRLLNGSRIVLLLLLLFERFSLIIRMCEVETSADVDVSTVWRSRGGRWHNQGDDVDSRRESPFQNRRQLHALRARWLVQVHDRHDRRSVSVRCCSLYIYIIAANSLPYYIVGRTAAANGPRTRRICCSR